MRFFVRSRLFENNYPISAVYSLILSYFLFDVHLVEFVCQRITPVLVQSFVDGGRNLVPEHVHHTGSITGLQVLVELVSEIIEKSQGRQIIHCRNKTTNISIEYL